jgi:hypothetical protein
VLVPDEPVVDVVATVVVAALVELSGYAFAGGVWISY